MTMSAPVAVIVLNWNRPELTDRALEALRRLTPPAPRVLVVDNGSTDDSVARVSRLHPEVEILPLGENRGFAAGMNAGIRHVRSDGLRYVWLLNNDTEVESSALTEMLAVADSDGRIGAVGSVLSPLGASSEQPVFGGRVRWWLGLSGHVRVPPSIEEPEYLVGASLLVRCDAIDEIGGLDEAFFLYWEDTDYCLRLKRAGWRLAVAERAIVHHRVSATLARGHAWEVYLTYSAVRFFRKHAPVPIVPVVCGAALRAGRGLALGRPRLAGRIVRAAWSAWAGRPLARVASSDEPTLT